MPLHTRPLDADTWDAWAALVERNRGVWGGCWCMEFHPDGKARGPHRREAKHQRVLAGSAHAALVMAEGACVGWAQYGPTAELTRIKHGRAYAAGLGEQPLPDWRITCFFVDPGWRRRGVADAALGGALQLIAQAGGGRVEGYPEDTEGRRVSASFLFGARVALFERHGFRRQRPLGSHHWVMLREVAPATADALPCAP